MQKRKKHNKRTKKRKKNLYKSIALLLLSFLLIGTGISGFRLPWEDVSEPLHYGTMIYVFGEDFDSLFASDIHVEFNDLGKLELVFEPSESADDPQNAWVLIWEPLLPYTWSIEGNVENRKINDVEATGLIGFVKHDWTSEKTGLVCGKSDEFVCFRLTVDDDKTAEKIMIQLEEEDAVWQHENTIKVAAPIIASMMTGQGSLSLHNLNKLNYFEEIVKEEGINLNDGHALMEYAFSVGKIDGVALSPTFSKVTGCYKSEKYYRDSSYRLKQKQPTYGEEMMQYITWEQECMPFAFSPTIEYEKKKHWIPKLTEFILLAVGGFLLPLQLQHIYAYIMYPKQE